MEHIPNPFGISTLAIVRLILARSSVITSQSSGDIVSYAISKALQKHHQLSNEKSQHTEKNGFENLILGDDREHEIALRIQNMRTTRFETNFKTLIKNLGNR
jgi:hypothetical protein